MKAACLLALLCLGFLSLVASGNGLNVTLAKLPPVGLGKALPAAPADFASTPIGLVSAPVPSESARDIPRDTRFYLDFDDDGDPWTLSSFAVSDTALPFKLVMETADELPNGCWWWALLVEPHCVYFDPDSSQSLCWYLCTVLQMQWDRFLVSQGEMTRYPGPGCHSGGINFTIAQDAPLQPRQRYFIGTGLALPDCGPPPAHAEGCPTEPHELRMWFKEIDLFTNTLTFACPASSVISSALSAARLGPVQPNPVREALTLSVFLDRPSAAQLSIHDVTGRVLAVLFRDALGAGESRFSWDLRSGGREVPSGVYLVRLEAAGGVGERGFVVVR